MREQLKLIFFGTSEFAIPSLVSLIGSPHKVLGAVTRPPRPAGRGRKLSQPPVYEYISANEPGIPVHQPSKLDAAFTGMLEDMEPDLMITASYGAWLPGRLLRVAPLGVVNVHPSLLPLYRGAAPVARAILDGREDTGVSFMLTDEGWDTGPVIASFRVPIRSDDTAGSLEERLAGLAGDRVVSTLEEYRDGVIGPVPQSGDPVYAEKLTTEETWLDWSEDAERLERKIRAFNPSPGARTSFRGGMIKILTAGVVNDELPPGSVLVDGEDLIVGCGRGSLKVLELQPASKRGMTSAEFLRGSRISSGELLEGP